MFYKRRIRKKPFVRDFIFREFRVDRFLKNTGNLFFYNSDSLGLSSKLSRSLTTFPWLSYTHISKLENLKNMLWSISYVRRSPIYIGEVMFRVAWTNRLVNRWFQSHYLRHIRKYLPITIQYTTDFWGGITKRIWLRLWFELKIKMGWVFNFIAAVNITHLPHFYNAFINGTFSMVWRFLLDRLHFNFFSYTDIPYLDIKLFISTALKSLGSWCDTLVLAFKQQIINSAIYLKQLNNTLLTRHPYSMLDLFIEGGQDSLASLSYITNTRKNGTWVPRYLWNGLKRLTDWKIYPFDKIIKQFSNRLWSGRNRLILERIEGKAKVVHIGQTDQATKYQAKRIRFFSKSDRPQFRRGRYNTSTYFSRIVKIKKLQKLTDLQVESHFKKLIKIINLITSPSSTELYSFYFGWKPTKEVNWQVNHFFKLIRRFKKNIMLAYRIFRCGLSGVFSRYTKKYKHLDNGCEANFRGRFLNIRATRHYGLKHKVSELYWITHFATKAILINRKMHRYTKWLYRWLLNEEEERDAGYWMDLDVTDIYLWFTKLFISSREIINSLFSQYFNNYSVHGWLRQIDRAERIFMRQRFMTKPSYKRQRSALWGASTRSYNILHHLSNMLSPVTGLNTSIVSDIKSCRSRYKYSQIHQYNIIHCYQIVNQLQFEISKLEKDKSINLDNQVDILLFKLSKYIALPDLQNIRVVIGIVYYLESQKLMFQSTDGS